MIKLLDAAFDPSRELDAFASGQSEKGAMVSFVGYVRGEGDVVQALELSHHPRLTAISLESIEQATHDRFPLASMLIVHRYGRLVPGEPIVLVAASATHRRAAFDAVDFAMDRLKTEAMFWKKEVRPDADRWIEARPEDLADRRRWAAVDD